MTLPVEEMLRRCYQVAQASQDPSTQNGALLVAADGFVHRGWNRPSPGLALTAEEWADRSVKYALVEHAERDAIFSAAANNSPTYGGTLYAAWAACADCARAIVQAGIKRVVRHAHPGLDRWADSIALGDRILAAGEVEVVTIEGALPTYNLSVRFNGELYYPSEPS